LAFARKCLTNQSREELPAQADAIGGDCVGEVVDQILVSLVHQRDGWGDWMGLADEKLVACEAEQSFKGRALVSNVSNVIFCGGFLGALFSKGEGSALISSSFKPLVDRQTKYPRV
jgi:hypothetical protein